MFCVEEICVSVLVYGKGFKGCKFVGDGCGFLDEGWFLFVVSIDCVEFFES